MNPLEEIKKLKHNEYWVWSESDYGKAEIWCMYDIFILFEIPTFGGVPSYYETYIKQNLERLIETVESWT
jgi:hypothetical protein